MHQLRLVAVSEDGSYAILAVPGRSGRFSLPIDDRLRTVARGQFSRLAQYDIEVENPLRPKEIQDRIRAGETADEIADAAGVPIERIRRFEGPVLAEREYRAQEAQRATVRSPGDSGPGPRLGEIVAERLAELGAVPDDARWDSRKRADGNWQVQLAYTVGGRTQVGEWIFDPRRRHVTPDDDQAARLCLPEDDLAALRFAVRGPATATVTPIAPRLGGLGAHHPEPRPSAVPPPAVPPSFTGAPPASPVSAGAHAPADQAAREPEGERRPAERDPAAAGEDPAPARERPVRKAAGARSRRASVPSWDEIMFGNSRQPD
ncbi:MAG TPA: septation protein SepH [Streptosporangiaceae bacterium]|nr:septation protein SepH [Streptosporangiaceae bacterium]